MFSLLKISVGDESKLVKDPLNEKTVARTRGGLHMKNKLVATSCEKALAFRRVIHKTAPA